MAGSVIVQVRYRYRLYPSPGQRDALARAFGCARVVFNDCLRLRDACHAAGEKISDTEVQRRVVTLAKSTPERAWLGEVASVALVQACQDARRAYRNWFDSLSGKRKGRKAGHPRFRARKDNRQSVRLTRNGFALHGNRLYVAKVGDVRVRWSRPLPSVPSSVTVIREADGRYYASFVVEVAATPLPATAADVGIDLGLSTLAATSDGELIANPRHLRARERRLARAQRALARKQKGSANRAKARVRVAVQHRKAREARADHLHKTALRLVRDNQAVYADGETLGEIVVRGNVVMSGYYNDPEATERAMGDGWFHTGDAAVVHPDGYVEIRDRIKDVIISGGENISSVEVEGTLLRHPAVQEAAIVGLPHEKWGETPQAFVVLRDGQAATEEEIIAFARERLAHFKALRGVTFVDELPKTATGKIQKYILRKGAPNLARQ
ncbi:MAG: RNA-guided endonuclease TnpB family protein [Streptosporangiales bacterium]